MVVWLLLLNTSLVYPISSPGRSGHGPRCRSRRGLLQGSHGTPERLPSRSDVHDETANHHQCESTPGEVLVHHHGKHQDLKECPDAQVEVEVDDAQAAGRARVEPAHLYTCLLLLLAAYPPLPQVCQRHGDWAEGVLGQALNANLLPVQKPGLDELREHRLRQWILLRRGLLLLLLHSALHVGEIGLQKCKQSGT